MEKKRGERKEEVEGERGREGENVARAPTVSSGRGGWDVVRQSTLDVHKRRDVQAAVLLPVCRAVEHTERQGDDQGRDGGGHAVASLKEFPVVSRHFLAHRLHGIERGVHAPQRGVEDNKGKELLPIGPRYGLENALVRRRRAHAVVEQPGLHLQPEVLVAQVEEGDVGRGWPGGYKAVGKHLRVGEGLQRQALKPGKGGLHLRFKVELIDFREHDEVEGEGGDGMVALARWAGGGGGMRDAQGVPQVIARGHALQVPRAQHWLRLHALHVSQVVHARAELLGHYGGAGLPHLVAPLKLHGFYGVQVKPYVALRAGDGLGCVYLHRRGQFHELPHERHRLLISQRVPFPVLTDAAGNLGVE
mmetsp:Transcript_38934/g.98158  ORF Transcript_38934/g.98158 Transcript_38934/m.98158 type:complete len:361 (-) Transcript_38934:1291-2373(-)